MPGSCTRWVSGWNAAAGIVHQVGESKPKATPPTWPRLTKMAAGKKKGLGFFYKPPTASPPVHFVSPPAPHSSRPSTSTSGDFSRRTLSLFHENCICEPRSGLFGRLLQVPASREARCFFNCAVAFIACGRCNNCVNTPISRPLPQIRSLPGAGPGQRGRGRPKAQSRDHFQATS